MVTFTIAQINDALNHIKSYIANHMRKSTTINLVDESDNRQYTIAELRNAGWDDFDLVRLMWADERTPWPVLKAFQDEKNRLDRENLLLPYKEPKDGPSSKSWKLLEFLEKSLDAYNATHITGEATQ